MKDSCGDPCCSCAEVLLDLWYDSAGSTSAYNWCEGDVGGWSASQLLPEDNKDDCFREQAGLRPGRLTAPSASLECCAFLNLACHNITACTNIAACHNIAACLQDAAEAPTAMEEDSSAAQDDGKAAAAAGDLAARVSGLPEVELYLYLLLLIYLLDKQRHTQVGAC